MLDITIQSFLPQIRDIFLVQVVNIAKGPCDGLKEGSYEGRLNEFISQIPTKNRN